MKKNPLTAYRKKRDFTKTTEPRGSIKKKNAPIFVIQYHEATHPHYDFRLEIDEVLKSWAVPKGPSLNPREKRLAIPTDDHPIEYAKFEGIIPPGEYGAGTVMVWDYGTYENIKEKDGTLIPMDKCYKRGQIEVFLKGEKLEGAFSLIRIRINEKDQWLLVKMRDEYADAQRSFGKARSVLTGRTIAQIKRAD